MSTEIITFRYNPDTPEGRRIDEWRRQQTNVSESIRRLILGDADNDPLDKVIAKLDRIEEQLAKGVVFKQDATPSSSSFKPKVDAKTKANVSKFFM